MNITLKQRLARHIKTSGRLLLATAAGMACAPVPAMAQASTPQIGWNTGLDANYNLLLGGLDPHWFVITTDSHGQTQVALASIVTQTALLGPYSLPAGGNSQWVSSAATLDTAAAFTTTTYLTSFDTTGIAAGAWQISGQMATSSFPFQMYIDSVFFGGLGVGFYNNAGPANFGTFFVDSTAYGWQTGGAQLAPGLHTLSFVIGTQAGDAPAFRLEWTGQTAAVAEPAGAALMAAGGLALCVWRLLRPQRRRLTLHQSPAA